MDRGRLSGSGRTGHPHRTRGLEDQGEPLAQQPPPVDLPYLANLLEPAPLAAGLTVLEAVDTRIGPGTIVCPDVVVGKLHWGKGINQAADVVLVAEITSPSNSRWDRVHKKQRYARARIPWYRLFEPDQPELLSVSMRLFRRDG